MYRVEQLAEYVVNATFGELRPKTIEQLKIRILDSLGCAFGAITGEPVLALRRHVDRFGGQPLCTLIGGGKTAPDRAALYNGALVRYLDFNDSYLGKGETCHPSDNLGAVLAACEDIGADGEQLLISLAVAYHVHCRLSDEAPVRAKGFDHTTQGSYAAAAGVSRALGLDQAQTANAVAIAGTAFNALRVTRTGPLSHWKGLAYPNTAFGATHAAYLARQGITGPIDVFEGNKGFIETIAGPFEIPWEQEAYDRVNRTIIKKYNAEIHSQSTLEGVLEMMVEYGIEPEAVESVDIEIFDVAYNIIGGGEEGAKVDIRTKEEADHSLPYMVAAAILDGAVGPEQYTPQRIRNEDIQSLLRQVDIRPKEEFSRRFPEEMPTAITLHTKDGESYTKSKRDYHGFFTRPMTWDDAVGKFNTLSDHSIAEALRRDLLQCVRDVETIPVRELTALLTDVRMERT